MIVVRARTLLDGMGSPPLRNAAVLVAEGRIQEVGRAESLSVPAGARLIDAGDATILPGLIDAHLHLAMGHPDDPYYQEVREDQGRLLMWAAANARACLAAGLTTVCDCGGPGDATIVLREAIRAGLLEGPRMIVAGAPITTTAGHCHWLGNRADSRDEVVKAVRNLVERGADFVKVMATGGSLTPASNRYTPQYSRAEIAALAAEAHRLRKHVVAHCNAAEGIRRCVAGGVDIIAHCNWLGETPEYLDYDDDVARHMGRQGTYVDMNIAGGISPLKGRDGVLREWHHGGPVPGARWEILRHMRQYGIQVYVTSDAIGRNFAELPHTLATMQRRFDCDPVDLIRMVTSVPAMAMGLQETTGALRPGLAADLLVVPGDLTAGLEGLQAPEMVFLEGRLAAVRGRVSPAARTGIGADA
ncbi:MAG TPA: amidohydrolase family protein [Symbiobacteriaceae bacterium]|nr:amidohydrolase family protein [Symbiobacteriaceae bacterium]